MRDNWFWRGAACAALLLALAYVVSRFTSAPPARAQGGRIIAITERENNLARLFVIDTSRSVIMVYGGQSAFRFSLLASRYFEMDAKATVKKEFPFKANGYSITEMEREWRKTQQPVRRGAR